MGNDPTSFAPYAPIAKLPKGPMSFKEGRKLSLTRILCAADQEGTTTVYATKAVLLVDAKSRRLVRALYRGELRSPKVVKMLLYCWKLIGVGSAS